MSNGPRDFNPYSRRFRKELDDLVDIKIRRLWFDNYQANKKLIEEYGHITNVPVIERAITVGAGWSLRRNIDLLKGCGTPIITTDKAFPKVLPLEKPYAVCALNTEPTDVSKWLDVGADSRDIWLIAPVTAHPDTFKNWRGPMAFTNPQNTCVELYELVQKEMGFPPTLRGGNVGFYAMILAYTLGSKQTAMLGMNYCYEHEHECMAVTRGNHCIKMVDVTGNYVYTAFDWVDSRRELLDFCFEVADDMRVVNCSEGGIIYENGLVEAMPFEMWRRL